MVQSGDQYKPAVLTDLLTSPLWRPKMFATCVLAELCQFLGPFETCVFG